MVVPYIGDHDAWVRLADNLNQLELVHGDELIVADNTGSGIHPGGPGNRVRVVRAAAERSAYHARNAGARAASNDWILFMDADCRPVPDLIDAYLAEPPAERCGAIGGTVVGSPDQAALIPRYARARGFLNMAGGGEAPGWRIAVGGNVMARRSAFEGVGGFVEGIRSGGDVDLSRRLIEAGWTIERRPAALVEHRHRDRLLPFLAAIARYAAGSRWLEGRYPGRSPRWPLTHELARAVRDAAVLAARREREQATFRALDGLGLVAHNVGYLSGNSASPAPRASSSHRGRKPRRS